MRFVVTTGEIDGGLGLAARRLAVALTERGISCDVAVPGGAGAGTGDWETVLPLDELTGADQPIINADGLARELERGIRPDLIIVADGRSEVLSAAARVAPTLMHAHLHWPACPDDGRFWNHLGRECTVTAGWKCLAIRPALGCSSKTRVLSPAPVIARQRLQALLGEATVGVLAISSAQQVLCRRHGVAPEMIAVLPNLGMRLDAGGIAAATEATPAGDRSAVVFAGRLSKEKGARLLPGLARAIDPAPLRIFGDGYLRRPLETAIPHAVGGQLSQIDLAGVLAWASAVVFPSLWPEPGGIVGIDAQLFGAPLGAFRTGGATDWPGAALFAPGDARALGAWAREQPGVTSARDPSEIAARQDRYWRHVSERAASLFGEFASTGRFAAAPPDAVRLDLDAARA